METVIAIISSQRVPLLFHVLSFSSPESGLSVLRTMLTAIQKPVLYGVTGSSARLLCHFLVELYQTYKNSMRGDIQRFIVAKSE